MLITQTIEVDQPIDAVWKFFDDIPQVAACVPGADLTNQVTPTSFTGDITIRTGPVKLEFSGEASVRSRNDATHTLVLDASGADKKGRGAASAILTAILTPLARGTKVDVSLELEISGAAAQYGRGLVNDVTAVLVQQTASSMQARLRAIAAGLDPNSVGGPKAASGLAIGLTALSRALSRVFARFFLPYVPQPRR